MKIYRELQELESMSVKPFTKPFINVIKNKFKNIDISDTDSSIEINYTKPYTNSEVVINISRNIMGDYIVTAHYKDDNYNYVDAVISSKDVTKFKRLLNNI